MIDLEVAVHSLYEDFVDDLPTETGGITVTLEMSAPEPLGDDLAEWAEQMIRPLALQYCERAATAVLAEIETAPEDWEELIGESFRWDT